MTTAGDDDRASRRARFSTVVHETARYTMLRFRPELDAVEQRPRRDWIFLFDADGSRDPLLARVQIDIIRTLLENAEHDDTFSVLAAGTRVHSVAGQPWRVSDENIDSAVKLLEQTQLIGALDLNKALEACRDAARAVEDPILVHLGSATPILGERATDLLLEQLPAKTPYVGVGVGRRWNRHFMKAAASQTGGYFTQINPDEVVGWRAFELLATLNTPRLLDLHVEADVQQTTFFNVKDSAVHGEEICALVRQELGQPAIDRVTVTGSLGGEPFRRTIPVEKLEEDAAYLPRIWAKLAIDDMIARGAAAHKSKIVELSKAMYVMSPFTSLLVLENDAMYQQYNVDRGRKDHWALYPCPAMIDVVHEPFLGPPPPDTEVVATEDVLRPSREEVLATLLMQLPRPADARLMASRFVTVPDGGTVLLGGIRLRRTNRLFGNGRDTGFGNATGFFDFISPEFEQRPTPLMLMVTPRIIIQEEEEELLWITDGTTVGVWDRDNDGDGFRGRGFGGGGFGGDGFGGAGLADFDSLIELITSTMNPDAWEEVGGPGSIDPFPTNLSLVIAQSQTVHDETMLTSTIYPVGDLVMPVVPVFDGTSTTLQVTEAWRQFGSDSSIAHPDAQAWQSLQPSVRYASIDLTGVILGAEELRILEKLDLRATFNYRDVPLNEVLEDIASRHDLPIVNQIPSLQGGATAANPPVTLTVNSIKLNAGLKLLLDPLGLTYIIEDDVIQVTTIDEVNSELQSDSSWCNETLLMIPRRVSATGAAATARGGQKVTRPAPRPHDLRKVNRLANAFRTRWEKNASQPNRLYPERVGPRRGHDIRHLASFARAITTTRSDTLAVLEQEADLGTRPEAGTIDDDARALIEAARRGGWQRVARQDDSGRELWHLTVDGQGRFRHEHKTEYGLTETVVSNGESLWHLYPELGLGATRTISRFHRAELGWVVPWLIPPAADMAVGADVRCIDTHTIAIAPHGADAARDDRDEPLTYHRVHLVFARDGRLAARHLVEMPAGKTVVRVTHDTDGTTRWFDADDKLQHAMAFSVTPTAAPDLQPPLADLVVLPMPLRTRDHVYQTVQSRSAAEQASLEKSDALQSIVADSNRTSQQDPVNWREADVLRLLAAIHTRDFNEMGSIIGRRFFAKGDRRIGFYTLLAATGQRWDVDKPVELDDGTATRMSPVADHPDSILARYLENQLRTTRRLASGDERGDSESQNHFMSQLIEFERLCLRWHPERDLPTDAESRHRTIEQAFDFIDRCDSPSFAFVMLRRVQRQFGNSQPHGRLAESLIKLESRGMTSYVIKYELARSLAAAGQRDESQQLFMELFRDSLDAGVVAPIDATFRDALKKRDHRFWAHEDSGKDFGGFMRGACAELIGREQRSAAIGMAWQCRQLGDTKLAGQLIDLALTGIPEQRRLGTSLVALEYLIEVGDYVRAMSLLQPLLTAEPTSESPAVWRLAAQVAHEGGMLARSISHLERAADLEYTNLAESYNVEQVRATYSRLLTRYQDLAKVVAADSHDASPLDLATRVIQAADRWRSLETDVTDACQQAAKLLTVLGHDDLAWDYLTTPLATKLSESTAWLDLAQTLRDEANVELADRAYRTAWEVESTNARILWEHAQMLEHAGRLEDAHQLYRRIVAGQWQPRFQPIQGRARRILEATD